MAADISRFPQGVLEDLIVADPGDAAAIPVTASASIPIVTGAGAETNTLAIPTIRGQKLKMILVTAGGGTRTITCAQAINQAGNTKMAFTQAVDAITLEAWATDTAGGTLRWRVIYNDGVTLS